MIRTRFVVDVLSGTSAGGINGILLAKALANERDFSVSRDLWLRVAGIGRLLAGAGGRARSLLDGDRLYAEARGAAPAAPRAGASISGWSR